LTDVAFYHLTRSRLEDTLPRLLEKTLAAGKRAVVLAGSPERVESLNALLWTFGRDSWLPHGSVRDGNAVEQPIWLTDVDENPNGAEYLFLTDGATTASVEQFERLFELFDGSDETAVAHARQRWAAYRSSGHSTMYWRQGPSGWEAQA
jgi:DNA polymerase-3 subunit chi